METATTIEVLQAAASRNCCITGPAGSGKTVLARTLEQLRAPDEVLLLSLGLAAPSEARAAVPPSKTPAMKRLIIVDEGMLMSSDLATDLRSAIAEGVGLYLSVQTEDDWKHLRRLRNGDLLFKALRKGAYADIRISRSGPAGTVHVGLDGKEVTLNRSDVLSVATSVKVGYHHAGTNLQPPSPATDPYWDLWATMGSWHRSRALIS